MSADDPPENEEIEPADVRAELDRQRSRGRDEGGDGIVELLSRVFDTDRRLRTYVHLRRQPHSTPEEIAEGTGLYPSAVRRVLADLHDDGAVEYREQGSSDEAEYTAVAPDELVDVVVGQLRAELGPGRRDADADRGRTEPVTIPVEEERDEDGEQ